MNNKVYVVEIDKCVELGVFVHAYTDEYAMSSFSQDMLYFISQNLTNIRSLQPSCISVSILYISALTTQIMTSIPEHTKKYKRGQYSLVIDSWKAKVCFVAAFTPISYVNQSGHLRN